MEIYTISFFGHRDFCGTEMIEKTLRDIIVNIIKRKYYVEFLVGRNGEFDQFVSSTIRKIKKEYDNDNFVHILILPYMTAEYLNNEKKFLEYYDEVEICEKSQLSHYKSAIEIRNKEIVKRSDLVICYISRKRGGAYRTVEYAKKTNKEIINFADINNLY